MCLQEKKNLHFLFLNKLTHQRSEGIRDEGTLHQNALPTADPLYRTSYLDSIWPGWSAVPFQPWFSLQDRSKQHKAVPTHSFSLPNAFSR